MPYSKEKYWESHTTAGGKRDQYSEGSVADRGGDNEKLGFMGYGFGKKKTKKYAGGMGAGYDRGKMENSGGGY